MGLRLKKFFSFDCRKVYNIFLASYIVILHFSLQSPENKCIIFCRLKDFIYICSVKSSFK